MPIGGASKWLIVVALTGSLPSRLTADCNGNGIPDTEDVESGTSADCNGSGIPDECEQSLLQLRQAKGGTRLTNLPRFIAAADLDADGHLDFVGAIPQQRDASRIFVYFNEIGTPGAELGDFSRGVLLNAGPSVKGFELADVDADGDVDVASASLSGAEVFWNDGTGSFSAPETRPLDPRAAAMTLADLNGDGKLDFVIVNRRQDAATPQVSILLNRATPAAKPFEEDGSFHPPHHLPGAARALTIAAADLDGDGDIDIVTADQEPTGISIFLNEGCGDTACSFSPAISIPIDDKLTALAAADLDRDTVADIVVSSASTVYILRNGGDGRSFETRAFVADTSEVNIDDIDSDDDLDIISTGALSLSILTNSGDGRFESKLEVRIGDPLRLIVPGDFDGDNGVDLAVVSGRTAPGGLGILTRSRGDVIELESRHVALPRRSLPHTAALADFDRDGDLDVVTGNGHRGTLSVVINEEPEGFTTRDFELVGGGIQAIHAMTHGDFDRDGAIDIVLGGVDSQDLRLHTNQGDWQFVHKQSIGGPSLFLCAGDLNGDGWLDVIATAATVFVFLNDGAGGLQEPKGFRAGFGVRNATPADFNGDGVLDLAVANSRGGTVSILIQDADGEFTGPQYDVEGSPTFVVAGDWNNDGYADVATANVPEGTFSALLNQQDGSFGEPKVMYLGVEAYSMATGDLNRDGRLDVVTTNEATSTISVLRNEGDGDFVLLGHLETGSGPRFAPIGDIDGDGSLDVVSANRSGSESLNQTGPSVTVFLNRAAASAAGDFEEHVCTLVDFAGLAAASQGASSGSGRLIVKYTVPARDDRALISTVLQNTKTYQLHEQFLATVFAANFPGLDANGLIGITQRRETRDYYIGAVERILIEGGFIYIFSIVGGAGPDEVLTVAEVGWVYDKLSEALALGSLYYAPDPEGQAPLARKAAASWEDPPFPIFDGTTGVNVEYIPYSQSVGYGRVRLFVGDEFDAANESGRFTFQDIAVIDHAPRDIEGVVGGVITAAPQGALSHVSVRTARRGTPNAFVDKAMLLFAPFEGKLVRLEVAQDAYDVTEATQEEAETFWDARDGLPEPQPFDAEHRGLDRFEEMDVSAAGAPEARYGGKAAGLARLQTILTGPFEEYRERGFAIPMAYYLDFMSENRIPSEVDGREVSYQEYLEELFELDPFRTDSEFRFKILDDFRDFAREHGAIPEGLVAAIAAQIEAVFGSHEVMVRHRSSSNVEDLLEFNGAGLYESTGVCAADTFDRDDLGPSLCDPEREPERTIERALRKVWTSLWTFRAHEERSFFKIPQTSATMGILVNRAFLKEKANGVAFTGDPANPRRGCYIVTAQAGEESVVSPEPGILPEVNVLEVADGEVIAIVRSRRSTLVDEGEVVLSDRKLKELGALMWHIDENYPIDTEGDRSDILLDMEFKLELDDALTVKQIRPFLISGDRPERPTFELVIPAGAEACGSMNLAAPSGDLMTEYESKSLVRFRAGTFALPSSRCVFFGELFDEVIVGPAQEVATPDGPGLFRVSDRRETRGSGTVFRFKYEQTFSLPGDRTFKVALLNLEFTVRNGTPLERSLVLDEDYVTFDLAMLGTSDDPPLAVSYSSCGYALLPEWSVAFDLDDGTAVRLAERFMPPDLVTKTGAAAVTAADVAFGTESRHVTSYWDLVYAAGRHNTAVEYWVFLDPPASIPGVEGEVYVVALDGRDRPDVADIVGEPQEEAAVYLDENFEVLARPAVLSFARQKIAFLRGDSNVDGEVNITDAIRTVAFLFRDGEPLECTKAADANDDGQLTVTDSVWTLLHLFGGRALPEPSEGCGVDRTPDTLGCDSVRPCL